MSNGKSWDDDRDETVGITVWRTDDDDDNTVKLQTSGSDFELDFLPSTAREIGQYLIAAADKIDGKDGPETEPDETREWFYLVTVSRHDGASITTATRGGTVDAPSSSTRDDACDVVFSAVTEQLDGFAVSDGNVTITHYYAEPNEVAR